MRSRSSEPEPEPPEPVHFARSRSRRTVLLGAGAGAGAGAGMLPRSRSRSRSRPKMSRLRIPDYRYSAVTGCTGHNPPALHTVIHSSAALCSFTFIWFAPLPPLTALTCSKLLQTSSKVPVAAPTHSQG